MRRFFTVAALTAALVFASPFFFKGDEGRAAGPGESVNTLTIGVGRDFYNGPEGQVYVHGSTNTWEGLTYLDETFCPHPWLAESWRSPDNGRTWIFVLRRGVRFHDGSLLTAKRAALTLNRLRNHPRYDPNHFFQLLESLVPRGERELVYRLREPVPFFPKVVSYYGSPLVAPETVSDDGRMDGLLGTGPFRLVAVKPGESVEVLAFEKYWGGRPAFDRVVFKVIVDADSRLMALKAGQIDAIVDFGGILPQQLDDLQSIPDIVVKRRELGNTHHILFNCSRPPFSRKAWRRWLAGQVDREQLVAAFAPGAGVVARNPYSRLAPEWNFGCVGAYPPVERPARKPETNHEVVILLHSGFAGRLPYLEIAQVIAQMLVQGGFKTAIRIMEPGGYRQARRNLEYDLVLGPTGFLTGDPDHHYTNFVSARAAYSGGWQNAEAEKLIDLGRKEADMEIRRELYHQLCELMNEEIPLLPLYHDVAIYAHNERVADLDMDVIFRPWLDRARPTADR